jgi:hypothetical protein
VVWNQIDPWKWKPKIQKSENLTEHSQVLMKHFEKVSRRYLQRNPAVGQPESNSNSSVFPQIYCINLINKKGSEGNLGKLWFSLCNYLSNQTNSVLNNIGNINPVYSSGKEFSWSAMNESCVDMNREVINAEEFFIPSMSYTSSFLSFLFVKMIWLDYHYQMKDNNNHIDALLELFSEVKICFSNEQGIFTIFHHERGNNFQDLIIACQNNIIRTNCMDCLDRTNVIQVFLFLLLFFKPLSMLINNFFFSLFCYLECHISLGTLSTSTFPQWQNQLPFLIPADSR